MYSEFFINHIGKVKGLDLIRRCDISSGELQVFPSWVPRLQIPSSGSNSKSSWASGISIGERTLIDDSVFRVAGIRVDGVAASFPFTASIDAERSEFRILRDIIRDTELEYGTIDALIHLLASFNEEVVSRKGLEFERAKHNLGHLILSTDQELLPFRYD